MSEMLCESIFTACQEHELKDHYALLLLISCERDLAVLVHELVFQMILYACV